MIDPMFHEVRNIAYIHVSIAYIHKSKKILYWKYVLFLTTSHRKVAIMFLKHLFRQPVTDRIHSIFFSNLLLHLYMAL